MRIIETCPVCGADIYDEVIDTYPPITIKRCSKCDWRWREWPEEVVRVPFVPPEKKRQTITMPGWRDEGNEYMFGYIPECCRGCSNHPSNGGSGVCACTLPYMTRSRTVPTFHQRTYTVTTNATEVIPDVIVSDHIITEQKGE